MLSWVGIVLGFWQYQQQYNYLADSWPDCTLVATLVRWSQKRSVNPPVRPLLMFLGILNKFFDPSTPSMRKGRDGGNGKKQRGKKKEKRKRRMKIEATTSLPAVDRTNADRWNAARSRQKQIIKLRLVPAQPQLVLLSPFSPVLPISASTSTIT